MSDKYILVDKVPVPVDFKEWVSRFDSQNRIVKQEMVGHLFVSTVFLGIDHAFGGGPPVLFETMVFDHAQNESLTLGDREHILHPSLDYQERYSTWELALEGHRRAVQWAQEHQS